MKTSTEIQQLIDGSKVLLDRNDNLVKANLQALFLIKELQKNYSEVLTKCQKVNRILCSNKERTKEIQTCIEILKEIVL